MFIIAQLLLGSYITRKLKIFGALLDPEKDICTRFQSSMRALLPQGSVVQRGTHVPCVLSSRFHPEDSGWPVLFSQLAYSPYTCLICYTL